MHKYLLLYLLVVGIVLQGQDTYFLETEYPVHDVNSKLQVVADPNNDFTPDYLLIDSTLDYIHGDQLPGRLQVGMTYWGKLKILTPDNLEGWTLHFREHLIGSPAWIKGNGKVDVFAFVHGSLIFHKKTGVNYSKWEREIKEKWMLNRVFLNEIPSNEEVTFIIKVQGNDHGIPPSFKMSIRGPSEPFYHEIYQSQNTFNVFMMGVTFITLLYHFLMFIYTRKRIFIWFSVWMVFCCMTMSMSSGFIIGSFTKFRFPIWMIVANGVVYSFWFFGRSFVNSKEKYPKLDKLILLLAFFQIVEILCAALYAAMFPEKVIMTNVGIHYYLLMIGTFLSILLSIYLVVKGDKFAKYFGVGCLISSLFFTLGYLWSLNIYRPKFDPYAWGILFQIVLFSFGIAYRRQQLSKAAEEEKLQAQVAKAETQRIKDLDEIKSKFFANISHEFRTPLALITGPIEHAAKLQRVNRENNSSVIGITPKTFSIIKNNTRRLQTLVDQLLDLSKIESGHVHLSLIQGGLVKYIRTIVASFESMAERSNISLNMSFPIERDQAFYDKDKIEKIITNLLSNAFKFTPKGGSVSFALDSDERFFSIEITDTGKGIHKNDILKIFDRFYRIEGSETKGSGIGLALTKELIDLYGGQISVNNTLGKGTIFKIRMPHSPKDLPETISVYKNYNPTNQNAFDSLSEVEVQKMDDSPRTNTSEKPIVLVVEDNKELQEFITDILSQSYNVLKASDGIQGERMAYEHIPEIVISDVMMPQKDGYQLCHDLKSNPKTSHVPIILLTAKAGHSNKMEGLTLGADAYITKPFDAEELKIRMKNLLALRYSLWEHYKSLDLAILPDLEISSAEDKFMQSVIQGVRENIDNEHLSVEDLARHVGFSRSQLHRKLKALTNKSANQMIIEIRLNEAHRMLEKELGTVSEIAYSVGYTNMSYFTKSFKEKFGVLPSKIRNTVS